MSVLWWGAVWLCEEVFNWRHAAVNVDVETRTLIWLRGERERGEENGGASDVGALADEKNKRERRRGKERKRLGRISCARV